MNGNERALIEALLDGDAEGWRTAVSSLGDTRASQVMLVSLTNACFKQFPEDPSVDEIATYVKQVRDSQLPDADLKAVPTELIVRAVLGDPEAMRGVAAEDLVAAEIVIVNTVARDHHLVGADRELFVTEVLNAID